LGGLSKKAYQYLEIQKNNSLPSLVLDGGSLLFKTERLSSGLAEQAKITAEGIVDAYSAMGYHAVGIARRDLAGGLAFLKEMSKKAEFVLLSANIVSKSTGKPIFAPKIIQTAGALSIGIIGITGSTPPFSFEDADDAEILPWDRVLPDIAAGLSETCDMIILLSNHDLKQNKKIAQIVPGIHMIIQAGTNSANLAPVKVDNTLIFQTAKQGKYLGWMKIDWLDNHTWEDNTMKKELAFNKKELDKANKKLELLRGDNTPETQKKRDLLRAYQEKKEWLLQDIGMLESEIEKQNREHPSSTYTNDFIALEIDLPDDRRVLNIVEKTKQRVNRFGKEKALKRSSPKTSTKQNRGLIESARFVYAGWLACAECHPGQTSFWKSTAHFHSYKTLEDKQQNFNLDCLPCHVTYDPGNKSIKLNDILSFPPELDTVGCELCHGSGISHNADPSRHPMVEKPAIEICTRCHTPKRDNDFIYQRDINRIACPPVE